MNSVLSTINPANGKLIRQYPIMTDAELEQLVASTHVAFLKWRHTNLNERAAVLRGIGDALRANKDKLAQLMTDEMGKLLRHSYDEVENVAAICDYTASVGPQNLQDIERELPGDMGRGVITHSPTGIVYGIQPWNFPAYQVVRYAIANLMAGNAILLRHAEIVTGTALLLEEIFRDGGLPENLFRSVLITNEQSATLVADARVRGVTFTGSSRVGQIIARQAADAIKKTVLELGSNDAYLVLEDADIDLAVKIAVIGRTYNNGEICIAAKRLVVVDAVYDEFMQKYVAAMEALALGDPNKDASDLGPIARRDLRDRLHNQVVESVAKGAEILCGGKIPDMEGFYYPATVLANVQPGQPAYDDELFGPVASVIRARNAENAMRIANDSRFGLGGGIISRNTQKAMDLAKNHFDTGMVFINGYPANFPSMPFGGVKLSGFGREHGGFGMMEFVNVKALVLQESSQ